jgi:uncharacterized damage-inducible protein DinB
MEGVVKDNGTRSEKSKTLGWAPDRGHLSVWRRPVGEKNAIEGRNNLNLDNIYLIEAIPGYTPQISRLMSMMNYARHTTLTCVEGLTTEQLDLTFDETSNSFGALLLHFAAVEYAYQLETFENRDLNEHEMERWGAALDLGDIGRQEIKGNSLEYYLDTLQANRNNTYAFFRTVTDDWLYEKTEYGGRESNRYFSWFHVLEDEISHRGQMRWLRKRLPKT